MTMPFDNRRGRGGGHVAAVFARFGGGGETSAFTAKERTKESF